MGVIRVGIDRVHMIVVMMVMMPMVVIVVMMMVVVMIVMVVMIVPHIQTAHACAEMIALRTISHI